MMCRFSGWAELPGRNIRDRQAAFHLFDRRDLRCRKLSNVMEIEIRDREKRDAVKAGMSNWRQGTKLITGPDEVRKRG